MKKETMMKQSDETIAACTTSTNKSRLSNDSAGEVLVPGSTTKDEDVNSSMDGTIGGEKICLKNKEQREEKKESREINTDEDGDHPLPPLGCVVMSPDMAVKFQAVCREYPEVKLRLRCLKNTSWHLSQLLHMYAYNNVATLDFANTSATMKVVHGIFPYLSWFTTPLVTLNLSGNSIGVEGARVIGEALETNGCLQELNLSGCDITGSPFRVDCTGLASIAKSLQSSRCQLVSLNVGNNSLEPNGARIVLNMVTFHRSITALDISDACATLFNKMDAIFALNTLVTCNKVLCYLDISGNPFTRQNLLSLRKALRGNVALTALYANRCNIEKFRYKTPIREYLKTQSIDNLTYIQVEEGEPARVKSQ